MEIASKHEEIEKTSASQEEVSVIEGEVQQWFMTVINECEYQARRRGADSKILNAVYSQPSIANLHSPMIKIN